MSMGDAVELFDYWRDFPPVHLILGAVHLSAKRKNQRDGDGAKPDESPVTGHKSPVTGEAETLQALFEVQQMSGSALGPQRQMPQHLKEMADYAEEVLSKMKIN
jgi:hypothetical protein